MNAAAPRGPTGGGHPLPVRAVSRARRAARELVRIGRDRARASRGQLPIGRHFALTWAITDGYGGMTAALLARTRAFVQHGDVTVDVLTLDAQADYPARENLMRQRGDLIDGMRLVNLWDWLREHPLPGGSLRLDRHAFHPLPLVEDADTTVVRRGGVVISRTAWGPVDGEAPEAQRRELQTDHYRLDGSLLASDRRATVEHGRSLVLCDESGTPVRSWGRVWHLYAAWLDRLTAREPSYLIVDSKTIAPFVAEYRRPHVTTVHVVHASHLVGTERPIGRLRESRKRVFENLGAFDAVAVLSERQRSDIEALLGRQDNLIVVRNVNEASGALTERDVPARRDATAGIMLASLERRKRVSHAIRAVAAQRETSASPATLDVYGEGPRRAVLEKVVARLSVGDSVRLRGYEPRARERLRSASFLLLTSTSEGFPLVLAEALAVGCLPIVYDIPYGPADIIRPGWNGYVVPAGDVDALAEAIETLVSLPSAEIARMRRNAVRSAAPFEPAAVTSAWARDLRAARRRSEGSSLLP